MLALDILKDAGRQLGLGLSILIGLLDPGLIVVGGSVAKAGDLLLSTAREEVLAQSISGGSQDPKITTTQLGDDVGLIGAVAVVRSRRRRWAERNAHNGGTH